MWSPFLFITTADQGCTYDFSTTALLIETVMEWSTTTDLIPWCGVRHSLTARVTNSNWNSVLLFIRAAYFTCQFKNTIKDLMHVYLMKSLRGSQLMATSISLGSHTISSMYNMFHKKTWNHLVVVEWYKSIYLFVIIILKTYIQGKDSVRYQNASMTKKNQEEQQK